jgi:hypothetical protein
VSNRRVVAIATSSFALGLLAGGVATFLWHGSLVGSIGEGALDDLAGQLQSEAYAKYRLATYPIARKALLDHAEYAAALAHTAKGIPEAVQSSAAGLSYARIAVAAERSGMPPDRDRLFRLAQDQYARRGEHPTTEQLRELVLSLDRTWDREPKGESP